MPVLGVVHAPLSPDCGPDTIAWADGLDHLLRNGRRVPRLLGRQTLGPGSIVFVNQAGLEWPVGHGRVAAPARCVAMPSIAYRLARVAAGDGVAAVSLNGPCGWDYAAGHALIRGAGGVLVDEAGAEVRYSVDGRSAVQWCVGGAEAAARDLVERDWGKVRSGARAPRKVTLTWSRMREGRALDRAVGCLLGQVAGDSLGSLVEFRSAEEIARQYPDGVRDLADGGTWNTMAGQPTDDSELALDLARTLIGLSDWSAGAVAEAYAGWLASEPFDVGGTTLRALSAAVRARTDKAAAASAAADRDSRSNGALMRCAPIGLWARSPAEAALTARKDAALTHPHPVCQAASASFAAAIATAVDGGDVTAMLSAAEAALDGSPASELHAALHEARDGRGARRLPSAAGMGRHRLAERVQASGRRHVPGGGGDRDGGARRGHRHERRDLRCAARRGPRTWGGSHEVAPAGAGLPFGEGVGSDAVAPGALLAVRSPRSGGGAAATAPVAAGMRAGVRRFRPGQEGRRCAGHVGKRAARGRAAGVAASGRAYQDCRCRETAAAILLAPTPLGSISCTKSASSVQTARRSSTGTRRTPAMRRMASL